MLTRWRPLDGITEPTGRYATRDDYIARRAAYKSERCLNSLSSTTTFNERGAKPARLTRKRRLTCTLPFGDVQRPPPFLLFE
jgi:hypothetical protein